MTLFIEYNFFLRQFEIFLAKSKNLCKIHLFVMKKYLSEKNALTVMVSLFCLVMLILSIIKQQSLWETIAFALAFSFSVEIICHRTKENQ
jgi:hypothetical protein